MAPKDISIIARLVDQVSGPMRDMNARLKGFADGVMGFFRGMVAGLAALGLGRFLADAIAEAREAETTWSRLGTAVGNAGADFARLRPAIEDTTRSVQGFSTATDDELREALTRMITITGDFDGSLTRLGLTADVAAYKNISVSEAADLVGKAMMGNEKVFKNFGIVAGTNAEKMEELRRTVAGFAEREAATFTGQLQLIRNAWDDVLEATGDAILNNESLRGNLGGLVGMLRNLETGIREHEASLGALVTVFAALGQTVGWVAGVLGMALTGAISVVQAAVVTFMGVWTGLKVAVQEVVGGILWSVGQLAVGAKGVLKKFGVDLGDGVAEQMRDAGARMVKEARQTGADTWSVMKESYQEIFVGTQEAEAELTGATAQGHTDRARIRREGLQLLERLEDEADGKRRQLTAQQLATLQRLEREAASGRIRLTKEQYDQLQKALKEDAQERQKVVEASHKRLRELEEIAFKAELELLSAQRKEYLEIERRFREKMKDMTAEDTAAAERLLREAHARQLLSWAKFGDEIAAQARTAKDTARPQLQGMSLDLDDLTAALERYNERTTGMTKAEQEAEARKHKIRDAVRDMAFEIADAADQLLAFMDALGLGDDKLRQLVDGVRQLGEAVGEIASGNIVGGILKGIGGIKDFVGGLFGKSEAEKKLEEALHKTRRTLEELNRNVGDLNINLTGKQISGVEGALQEFFRTGGANKLGWADRLGGLLLKRGVTMADLEEVAKTLQIDLRPAGKLAPQMLQQLMKAIGLIEPTQFSPDFRGQLDFIRSRADLAGTDALGVFTEIRELLGSGVGSPALAGALQGLDVQTVGGRSAALARLVGLQDALKAGTLASSELGGLTPAEFRAMLKDLADLLRDIGAVEADGGGTVPSTPLTPNEPPLAGAPAGGGTDSPDAGSAMPAPVPALPSAADVLAESRDYLASIDLTLRDLMPDFRATAEVLQSLADGGALATPPLAVDASIQMGDLVLHFGGPGAVTEAGVAGAVAGAMEEVQEEQLRRIDEVLGRYVLRAGALGGDATRGTV